MTDLLMQWSIYCDYPILRAHLKKYRDRFNKVIIYASDHNREHSYKDFLFEQVKETWVETKIDWTAPGIDWRQAETEPMLPLVESEWIFFTEPDFFVADWDRFYNHIEEAQKTSDAIGFWFNTAFSYLHPSCFILKKEVLDKTSLDFRAHPEQIGSDHFAMISRDLEKLGAKIIKLEDLGFKEWEDYFHLGGLTQNYIEFSENPDYNSWHRPELFYNYNFWSRQADVEQSPQYLKLSLEIEEKLNLKLDDKWTKFFK